MLACLTSPPVGNPIRGSNPVHQSRIGRAGGRVQRKLEQGPVFSRTPSRHSSLSKHRKRPRSPPSSDTPYDSSDDEILAPLTPPPMLRNLSLYVKSAKERPEPYKRYTPNIIERFCGEECVGCNGSKVPMEKDKAKLARRLKSLSPEARAQAVVAMGANVEWRRARAVTAALHIDAIEQHKKFICLTLESEAKTYVNAVSEPLETSLEALASPTASGIDDQKSCSVAAFGLELESFATADKELDNVESLTLQLMDLDASATSSDEDNSGDSFGSMCGKSRTSTESDD